MARGVTWEQVFATCSLANSSAPDVGHVARPRENSDSAQETVLRTVRLRGEGLETAGILRERLVSKSLFRRYEGIKVQLFSKYCCIFKKTFMTCDKQRPFVSLPPSPELRSEQSSDGLH